MRREWQKEKVFKKESGLLERGKKSMIDFWARVIYGYLQFALI